SFSRLRCRVQSRHGCNCRQNRELRLILPASGGWRDDMIWWWWSIPAVVGALGLLLLLSSLGNLFRGRIASGGLGTIGGGGLMAAAAIAALLGMNVQTYARMTYERPVATLQLKQLGPQYFEATVTQPA